MEQLLPQQQSLFWKGVGLLAGLLIGLGVVFAIASNWSHLSRMEQLALVGGAVALAGLCSMPKTALRLPAAITWFLTLGGLLAWVGQTYQTGADAWQLFAAWAVLMFPVCLWLRHDALWVLWILVLFVALSLWRYSSWYEIFQRFEFGTPFSFSYLKLGLLEIFPFLMAWLFFLPVMWTYTGSKKVSFRLVSILCSLTIAQLFWVHFDLIPVAVLVFLGMAAILLRQKYCDFFILSQFFNLIFLFVFIYLARAIFLWFGNDIYTLLHIGYIFIIFILAGGLLYAKMRILMYFNNIKLRDDTSGEHKSPLGLPAALPDQRVK